MTGLHAIAFLLVAFLGTAVAFTRDPVCQAIVGAAYGAALTLLIVLLGSLDVAFSVLFAQGIAIPLMQIAAITSVRSHKKT